MASRPDPSGTPQGRSVQVEKIADVGHVLENSHLNNGCDLPLLIDGSNFKCFFCHANMGRLVNVMV